MKLFLLLYLYVTLYIGSSEAIYILRKLRYIYNDLRYFVRDHLRLFEPRDKDHVFTDIDITYNLETDAQDKWKKMVFTIDTVTSSLFGNDHPLKLEISKEELSGKESWKTSLTEIENGGLSLATFKWSLDDGMLLQDIVGDLNVNLFGVNIDFHVDSGTRWGDTWLTLNYTLPLSWSGGATVRRIGSDRQKLSVSLDEFGKSWQLGLSLDKGLTKLSLTVELNRRLLLGANFMVDPFRVLAGYMHNSQLCQFQINKNDDFRRINITTSCSEVVQWNITLVSQDASPSIWSFAYDFVVVNDVEYASGMIGLDILEWKCRFQLKSPIMETRPSFLLQLTPQNDQIVHIKYEQREPEHLRLELKVFPYMQMVFLFEDYDSNVTLHHRIILDRGQYLFDMNLPMYQMRFWPYLPGKIHLFIEDSGAFILETRDESYRGTAKSGEGGRTSYIVDILERRGGSRYKFYLSSKKIVGECNLSNNYWTRRLFVDLDILDRGREVNGSYIYYDTPEKGVIKVPFEDTYSDLFQDAVIGQLEDYYDDDNGTASTSSNASEVILEPDIIATSTFVMKKHLEVNFNKTNRRAERFLLTFDKVEGIVAERKETWRNPDYHRPNKDFKFTFVAVDQAEDNSHLISSKLEVQGKPDASLEVNHLQQKNDTFERAKTTSAFAITDKSILRRFFCNLLGCINSLSTSLITEKRTESNFYHRIDYSDKVDDDTQWILSLREDKDNGQTLLSLNYPQALANIIGRRSIKLNFLNNAFPFLFKA